MLNCKGEDLHPKFINGVLDYMAEMGLSEIEIGGVQFTYDPEFHERYWERKDRHIKWEQGIDLPGNIR